METDADFEEQSSTDEDYIPSGDESDDNLSGEEYVSSKRGRSKTKRKAATKRKAVKPRKRRRGIKLDDEDDEDDEEDDEDFNKAVGNSDSNNESEDNTDDDDDDDDEVSATTEPGKKLPDVDKKKSDSLWADFLKDVDPPAKPKTKTEQNLPTKPISEEKQQSESVAPTKKTITEVFDFAGESVSVTKEVDADSEEAKQFENKNESAEQSESNKIAQVGVKRSSNIGNILGKVMGKKPKMSTLDKSRLDWETFKKDENINDDLRIHNKGKDGYLERQAFLQRVDIRQFEVEKSIREVNRSKR